MKFFKNPKLLLVISMIVFGTIGLFVKYIPLSSGEIALYRAILAIILLGIFLLITKQKIDIKTIKKDLLLLLISLMAPTTVSSHGALPTILLLRSQPNQPRHLLWWASSPTTIQTDC